MALVGVSFSLEVYYNYSLMWLEVTRRWSCYHFGSGWFPCFILIYWPFFVDWLLMVFLGGPVPALSHSPLSDFTPIFFMGDWGAMVHLLELLHSCLGTLTLPGMGVKISGSLTQVPGAGSLGWCLQQGWVRNLAWASSLHGIVVIWKIQTLLKCKICRAKY